MSNEHNNTGRRQPSPIVEQLQARVAYLEARLEKAGEEGEAMAAYAERIKAEALWLADSCENEADLPLHKWALTCARSVSRVRQVADETPRTSLVNQRAEYPMQPIALDEHGTVRFEGSPIISYLASEVTDLNHLAIWCAQNQIGQKYQEQLAQLIGYSVSGYGTLSYVSDRSFDRASAVADSLQHGSEEQQS